MGWLLKTGLSTGGSVFGTGTGAGPQPAAAQSAPPAVNVEGGPPASVRVELQQLRDRIARSPKDDVALTQLGDLYLAVDKYSDAIPYYKRALAANPHNVAAQEGLSEAQAGLKDTQ
jgi:cytochrome c-type biogenesis protein CcmH/NrfG